MKKFFICLGATAAYWALIFIGPVLVMLFNNIGYYFSGAGWGPGSLMYSVLRFLSQPLSCFIACGAAEAVGGGQHRGCTLVNCIIGVCVCALFAIVASDKLQLATMIVSAIACTITAVLCATKVSADKNSAITTDTTL